MNIPLNDSYLIVMTNRNNEYYTTLISIKIYVYFQCFLK